MKVSRDFYSRPQDEQVLVCQETWCGQCNKPDLGMSNPIEHEDNGFIFVEGCCNVCGTTVISRIEERINRSFCFVKAVHIEIKLIPQDQIHTIVPLSKLLNPTLPENLLQSRLEEMLSQGYQCAGLYLDNHLIGICGLWIITKFYVGKHIEPDNFFILPEYRRQGFGKQLLEWVCEYGKAQGCVAVELNCYALNDIGNAFWEQEGFTKIGYHYQRLLD
jgi:GNAT superfamily N-acetyltransferase